MIRLDEYKSLYKRYVLLPRLCAIISNIFQIGFDYTTSLAILSLSLPDLNAQFTTIYDYVNQRAQLIERRSTLTQKLVWYAYRPLSMCLGFDTRSGKRVTLARD